MSNGEDRFLSSQGHGPLFDLLATRAVLRRRRSMLAALSVAVPLALGAASWAHADDATEGSLAREVGSASAVQGEIPSIEEKTSNMEHIDGFFPLYWDESTGRLWMEISRLNTEVLHMGGLSAGLGSNDIGLDRGQLGGSRIVEFQRIGPKIMMVQPNYTFRADSDNPSEVRAVEDAFARSILWGFKIEAQTDGRALVDLTDFLVRDTHNITPRLRPGSYRLDASRSAIYRPMILGFPENTEIEVVLTFTRQSGGGGGGFPGFGGDNFEGVGDVAASADAVTLRLHHSLVQLPDDNYKPRAYDPGAGYFPRGYQDYAVPLGEPMAQRFISRHRLQKRNPGAAVSDPVEPIVYYLDPGTPEPVRSALLEGARWWNQAFEAAGYRDAFRVEMRPDDVSSFDIRYNVINWVHRSTRGWSYGGSVTDPRTGEIIKGVVALGSLRVRQDYMIAEGLLSPYENGDETPNELAEWALARVRQLSAHEVGHTIGLAHNYYDSSYGRISVMDYPHPLITLAEDGSFDFSEVYDVGIGEWDKVAVNYGYQDFPAGTDEEAALAEILDEAWGRDIRFLTNQDIDVHPRADQWSNGTDAATELDRMLDVRSAALDRFGEKAIKTGMPLATIEEVLVPLYLHHRYQVTAAASVVGGLEYVYALRGDGRDPVRPVAGDVQREALAALMRTLEPGELAIPRAVLEKLPPRPMGIGFTRELFPRRTGLAFDPIAAATVAADHTISSLLSPERAARLVIQQAMDPSLPGLGDVIDELVSATFAGFTTNEYEAEVSRAAQRVLAERVMGLASAAPMPQVRAVANLYLEVGLRALHDLMPEDQDDIDTEEMANTAHIALLIRDISRFLERPAESLAPPGMPSTPPGAPIGDPANEWLGDPTPRGPGGPTSRWLGGPTSRWLGDPAMQWLLQPKPLCSQGWER